MFCPLTDQNFNFWTIPEGLVGPVSVYSQFRFNYSRDHTSGHIVVASWFFSSNTVRQSRGTRAQNKRFGPLGINLNGRSTDKRQASLSS